MLRMHFSVEEAAGIATRLQEDEEELTEVGLSTLA